MVNKVVGWNSGVPHPGEQTTPKMGGKGQAPADLSEAKQSFDHHMRGRAPWDNDGSPLPGRLESRQQGRQAPLFSQQDRGPMFQPLKPHKPASTPAQPAGPMSPAPQDAPRVSDGQQPSTGQAGLPPGPAGMSKADQLKARQEACKVPLMDHLSIAELLQACRDSGVTLPQMDQGSSGLSFHDRLAQAFFTFPPSTSAAMADPAGTYAACINGNPRLAALGSEFKASLKAWQTAIYSLTGPPNPAMTAELASLQKNLDQKMRDLVTVVHREVPPQLQVAFLAGAGLHQDGLIVRG